MGTVGSPQSNAVESTASTKLIGSESVVWEYSDFAAEYRAIRQSTGIVDLSTSGLLCVSGSHAKPFLQSLFTRDIEYLSHEACIMGMFVAEDGSVVDVSTILRQAGSYWIETSVGNGDALFNHLSAHSADFSVELADIGGDTAIIGIEGPHTWDVVDPLLEESVSGLPFQGVRPSRVDDLDAVVARTGFTGEFGVQLFVPATEAKSLWQKLTTIAQAAGQRALEMAMIEVRQPLFHRELAAGDSVRTSGFNWLVDFDKCDYLGYESLSEEFDGTSEQLSVGFVADADTVLAGEGVYASDREVGIVVCSDYSPGLGAVCGIARIASEIACAGLTLGLGLGDPPVRMRTVSSPAVVPISWSTLTES